MAAPDLAQLYDRHASALYAFLLNFTRREADTRDLLQEIFIKLARQPDLLDGVREERAFLIRMAHRAAIDLIRRQSTREKNHTEFAVERTELFAGENNPDATAFRTALADALGELPEDQRAVVHLKLWEGLTFDAIATALDLSPHTAASRYRYGLDKLRGRLRPLYEDLP